MTRQVESPYWRALKERPSSDGGISRVLVTGGTGFVGAHLTRALLATGAEVMLLVRATSSEARLRSLLDPAAWSRLTLRQASLSADAEPALREAVAQARPEVVFHLAGDARSRAPLSDEPAMLDLHAGGAQRLADAAVAAGARRLVAASTCDVYGGLPSPARSDGPLDPRTPYARSKARADELLLAMHRAGTIEAVILRPYLVYGPAQAPGQFIPSLIAACFDELPFPMSDGTQRRDLIHVDDVARAFVLAATAPLASRASLEPVLDICTGEATPILDVATAVVRVTRPLTGGPLPGAIARGASEPDDRFGDPQPAAELLGFRSEIAWGDGIARTVSAFAQAKSRETGR